MRDNADICMVGKLNVCWWKVTDILVKLIKPINLWNSLSSEKEIPSREEYEEVWKYLKAYE